MATRIIRNREKWHRLTWREKRRYSESVATISGRGRSMYLHLQDDQNHIITINLPPTVQAALIRALKGGK